jgi:peptidoglycan/xylan/chitin deacetylase (PgdA/CDA1 family)
VKRLVETVLGPVLGQPRRMSGQALILAYHNVVPDELVGHGDRSLHLPWSRFLEQLAVLQQHCEVRPLTELLSVGQSSGRPQVALTFDDAYRGAVELALPELDRRGLPTTLFVAPGLLGSRSFWWDELATPGAGLAEPLRRWALEDLAGWGNRIRDCIPGGQASARLPEWYASSTEAQVRSLGTYSGLTLGAHTWSHPNLARLGESEVIAEVSRSLDWIGTSGVPSVPLLAYPYGLRSDVVDRAAERAGCRAGLLVSGGWFTPPIRQDWLIPRYNVPAGLSTAGFVMRLSGNFLT